MTRRGLSSRYQHRARMVLFHLFIIVGLTVIGTGCISYYHTTTIRTPTYVKIDDNVPALKTQQLQQTVRVVGLFVGVSNYGDAAPFATTVAHTISAAMVGEMFYQLGRQSLTTAPIATTQRVPSTSPVVRRLVMLADLTLPKTDPAMEGVAARLEYNKSLGGLYSRPYNDSPNLMGVSYGDGKLVTRNRITTALEGAVQQASQLAATDGPPVLLVVYIAAHGWINSDGKQYLLPADVSGDDPGTWLGYDDILNQVRPFTLGAAQSHGHALVIFDACQVPRDGVSPFARPERGKLPPNMTVVESTSPGEYAWHMNSNISAHGGNQVIGYESRGIGAPGRPKDLTINENKESKMSVLPVALQEALPVIVKQFGHGSGSHPMTGATSTPVGLQQWLRESKQLATTLLASIPEYGQRALPQEITVRSSDGETDVAVFDVSASGTTAAH